MFNATTEGNSMNLLISKQAAEIFGVERRIIGASLQELSKKWCDMRDASGEGASTIGSGGNVLNDSGKRIATISYNGRVWNGTTLIMEAQA